MEPIVSTTEGRVRGTAEGDVFAFRGIPYAAPPVGDLRFRSPRRHEPWDGVREATEFGPIAWQLEQPGVLAELVTPEGPNDEDCLSLNVFTPSLGADDLPVLVWIHGGGFYSGAGSESIYRGESFARDGVVCVTINYRLGPLGFLYVGDDGDDGAGDYGILDQIAALRWVQQNIAAFGGDPSRVTIAGQSAGGWSVGTLLGAPSAHELFQRAIVQSGDAHHGIPREHAEAVADLYCGALGVDRHDLAALRAVPAPKLIEATWMTLGEIYGNGSIERFGSDVMAIGLPFMPAFGTPLVPERPIDAVAAGAAAGIELLVGHTGDEYRLFLLYTDPTKDFIARFGEGDTGWVPGSFELAFPGRGSEALEVYRRNHPGAGTFELLCALGGDSQHRVPAVRLAEAQAAHASTYAFRFSWPAPSFDGTLGAAHCVELPFMWDAVDDPTSVAMVGSGAPQQLATDMHRAWVSFVADGDPNHEGIPSWPTYDVDDRAVMDFDTEVAVVNAPLHEIDELWGPNPCRPTNSRNGLSLAGES